MDVGLSLSEPLFTYANSHNNLVFSPVAVQLSLCLIAAGSSGSTRSQLLKFLDLQSLDHLNSFASLVVSGFVSPDGSPELGGPEVSLSHQIRFDSSLSLSPSFKELMDNVYKATTRFAEFKTKEAQMCRQINAFFESKAFGVYREALPVPRLSFSNEFYFRGAWSEKFELSETTESEFHLLDGTSIQVPFMTSKRKQTASAFDGFKVLGLPYQQWEDKRSFSMYLFLPDTKDGLLSLEEKVCSEPGFLELRLPRNQVETGDFRIPRFKISTGLEASELLMSLGVNRPFNLYNAGLMEMLDPLEDCQLYASGMFHNKSSIEVNEEGTKDAAANATTPVKDHGSAVRDGNIDFVADHPFLFLIRENVSGMVLCIGQVFNPLSV